MVSTEYDREVCIMQNAETVLNVTRERGERELPLENIYRLLCNRELYLRAYGHLYSNQGGDDQGNHRKDRGRHVTGQNRPTYRGTSV